MSWCSLFSFLCFPSFSEQFPAHFPKRCLFLQTHFKQYFLFPNRFGPLHWVRDPFLWDTLALTQQLRCVEVPTSWESACTSPFNIHSKPATWSLCPHFSGEDNETPSHSEHRFPGCSHVPLSAVRTWLSHLLLYHKLPRNQASPAQLYFDFGSLYRKRPVYICWIKLNFLQWQFQ